MSAQFLLNPFTQRGAIRDPAQFFGRPDARRLITNPGRSGRPHDPFRQGRAAESEGGMKQRSSMKRRKLWNDRKWSIWRQSSD